MKRYILIIIFTAIFAFSHELYADVLSAVSKKATYRYDFERSGYTDLKFSPPLTLEWFVNTSLKPDYVYNPRVTSSLIGEGAVLYFGTLEKTFSAFDTTSKQFLWQFTTEGDVHAGATLHGDKIYFGDTKGRLYCLDKKSGEVIWQRVFGNEILSSPLVVGDRLYFSDMSDTLYALSTANGATKWKVTIENYLNNIVMRGVTSPAYSDGKIYQGASDGYLYCFDAKSSDEVYRKKVKDGGNFFDVDSPAAVDDGTVYSSSYDGSLLAVGAVEPVTKWTAKVKGNGLPAFNSDALIVSSSDGSLYSIDKQVGNILWETELSKNLSAPIITDEYVFVASEDFIYVVDIKSGAVKYEYEPGSGISSELCLIDDNLYFISNKGYLYSFKSD